MIRDFEIWKLWVLDSVGCALVEIEFSNDATEIERKLHLVGSMANQAYEVFHRAHCVVENCDHSFMRIGGIR